MILKELKFKNFYFYILKVNFLNKELLNYRKKQFNMLLIKYYFI